jgi:hypothetical protein
MALSAGVGLAATLHRRLVRLRAALDDACDDVIRLAKSQRVNRLGHLFEQSLEAIRGCVAARLGGQGVPVPGAVKVGRVAALGEQSPQIVLGICVAGLGGQGEPVAGAVEVRGVETVGQDAGVGLGICVTGLRGQGKPVAGAFEARGVQTLGEQHPEIVLGMCVAGLGGPGVPVAGATQVGGSSPARRAPRLAIALVSPPCAAWVNQYRAPSTSS